MSADLRTSESVTEGHPDKVADLIADSILDACLETDPGARVAIEVLVKSHLAVVAGELTTEAEIDVATIVRQAVEEIGYVDPEEAFHANGLEIRELVSVQAREIARGVGQGIEQGAGDQGLMVGYATNETSSLMPLPISLAHSITRRLACDRRTAVVLWLQPDGKAQVTVKYADGRPAEVIRVIVSTQHRAVERRAIEQYVHDRLLPVALGEWYGPHIEVLVNPAGTFIQGGPSADCGVTGRKIIVDTYGGAARHGGGAFSGKDPSKVDRSGAYFSRWAARQVVSRGVAGRAEVEVAYAIGRADPVALNVETFGTGDPREAAELVASFDFRPAAIIQQLGLRRPIYQQTTNYGHFGKPGLSWET